MKLFISHSKKIGEVLIKQDGQQYTLCSPRLEARSLNQESEGTLITQYIPLLEKAENVKLFGMGVPWSMERVQEFIHNERSVWDAGNAFSVFSLYLTGTNEFLGFMQIKSSKDEFKYMGSGHSDAAEISYIIDSDFWGKGYGTEIAILAKKFIKMFAKECEIKEIVATVHPENVGSKRILQKTLKRQEPEAFSKFGGQPRLLFFKPLDTSKASFPYEVVTQASSAFAAKL